MNPDAMTIINPWKEYLLSQGSSQKPPVFNSCVLLTEPHGLSLTEKEKMLIFGIFSFSHSVFKRFLPKFYEHIPNKQI